jgi:hypothetical protein
MLFNKERAFLLEARAVFYSPSFVRSLGRWLQPDKRKQLTKAWVSYRKKHVVRRYELQNATLVATGVCNSNGDLCGWFSVTESGERVFCWYRIGPCTIRSKLQWRALQVGYA